MLAASRRRNQHSSLILRLPAELRNKIFAYIFSDYVLDYESSVKLSFCTRELLRRPSKFPAPLLSITYVCRQLYTETKTLPFQQCPITESVIDSSVDKVIKGCFERLESN